MCKCVSMSSGYDTLDSIEPFGNLIEMFQYVIAEALKAPDLCGVLTTGTLDLSPSKHAQWGGSPATFGDRPEVYHVRSAPKGRIGLPLGPREVRKVSVLVRKSAAHRVARITNIKLWRLPKSGKLDEVIQSICELHAGATARSKRTYGVTGIGMQGLHLFSNRPGPTSRFLVSHGCQTLLSSVAKIVHLKDDVVTKIEASTLPHYVVAAALAGFSGFQLATGTPLPHSCKEAYDEITWDAMSRHLAVCFRRELARTPYAQDEEETPLMLMFAADDVFEQLSLVGYLDLRADPFFCDSLSEDQHRPSGMALIVALAVTIATHPERWVLPPTQQDDAYATKEAAFFVESVVPSVLALDDDDSALCGEQPYTFDLVMNIAHAEFAEVLSKLRAGSAKHLNLDARNMERSSQETMHFLFYLGVQVCQDLFGLPPSSEGAAAGLYSRYGFAAQLADPMTQSRAQSAHEMNLGNVVAKWPTLRTSTRGRRQLALADVFVEVNEWLCTGKYRGTILASTTEAPVSVHKNDILAENATALRADESPTTQAVRSSKKKKRIETNALLAERSKTREATQQLYAADSLRSLFKPSALHERRIEACSERVCGAALNSASGIFCDVLQLGGCGGPSYLFEFASYLVSPTMAAPCAHCTNNVHVVHTIAFVPTDLQYCPTCNQPRCLACVWRDMAKGAAPPAACNTCRVK